MEDTQVHIIDDDDCVRHALSLLLGTVGLKTLCYPDGNSFIHQFGPHTRGCILLDVRMPGVGGLAVLERVVHEPHHPPVIMLSGHGTIRVSVRALRSGAFEFLEKPLDDELVIETVQSAISFDAENERRRSLHTDISDRIQHLSPRERQVMDHIVEGKMNKQIASELNVCVNTIEVHRSSLMRKLRVRSVADLVRISLSLRHGLELNGIRLGKS